MSDVYVVTGGTRGIGAATARILAHQGHSLVLGYRSDETSAAAFVESLDCSRVIAVRCNVADPGQVAALFAVADEVGPLAGFVNCAGSAGPQSRFEDIDAQRWHDVLAVNVIGTALCCREAVIRMRASEATSRAIVNLSSRAAVLGSPGEYVDYAASKAAVDTLTRGLALEVAGAGIRVNAVRPGIIDTEFHAAAGDPERAARLAPSQPMGRVGTADEVAEAIVWLLSEQASYVTGTTLDVSGGR